MDEAITVIIAVGAHRQNTRDEFVELCSSEVCHRVRVVNHDAFDTDNMVHLGTTARGTEVSVNRIVAEADKVICTGGVIYHYMVGYGGGRKSIMPGVSSLKTIQQSHIHAMCEKVGKGSNPVCANMATRGNPAHDDMMDVASFVNPISSSTWCPIWTVRSAGSSRATGWRPGWRPPSWWMISSGWKSRSRPISSSPPPAAFPRTSTSIRPKRPSTTRSTP
jgi:hypothetical protein